MWPHCERAWKSNPSNKALERLYKQLGRLLKDGSTLAHLAAEDGDYKLLRDLLHLYPSLPFARDQDGNPPLAPAQRKSHTDYVELFTDAYYEKLPLKFHNLTTSPGYASYVTV